MRIKKKHIKEKVETIKKDLESKDIEKEKESPIDAKADKVDTELSDKLDQVKKQLRPSIEGLEDELELMTGSKDTAEKLTQDMVDAALKSEGKNKEKESPIHKEKWERCVKDVKKKSPDVNPYAVCTASIGYEGSIKKPHRRKDENEERIASDAIKHGQTQGEVGDEFYDLLKSLPNDDKPTPKDKKDEPINDLPFESVKPKMTKNELIESVVGKKTRKVIKTISIKNLRNE